MKKLDTAKMLIAQLSGIIVSNIEDIGQSVVAQQKLGNLKVDGLILLYY